MPTTVKENYLKALYFLNEKNDRINITELSKKLGVSKPTVNNMVKSLEEKGWVVYKKYKPVQLTAKGKKAAALVIRKHRLTEMFLFKVMGFGWEEVHEIAEQMEHIDSNKLFERMDEILEHPSVDPHGSPIPDINGKVTKREFQHLIDLKLGQKGKLSALENSSKELLQYLNKRKIGLGVVVELIKIEPLDKSCVISCDGKPPMAVSRKLAEGLLVEII
ncbi:MAG: DtxR family Mn-dependent transcriptional regulator [Polaribacter sp.]|jgi:DtxR family Mn-dependent transcriptional regulator